MALPSDRRTGLGGTAVMGTLGAVYDSADCQEWSLTIGQRSQEAHAKSDTFEVSQVGRRYANGTIKKLCAATAFTKSALLGLLIEDLVLTTGDGGTLGGSGGDAAFTGPVVIDTVGYVSPDGLEAEDLTWHSVGEFTLIDDVA